MRTGHPPRSRRAAGRGVPEMSTSNGPAILAHLRRLCLALPDTAETRTFGHPTFQTRGRTFAVLEVYRGELCIVFRAERLQQAALVESTPRFFVAPYGGRHGWVSLKVGHGVAWGEVGRLLEASHALQVRGRRSAGRGRRKVGATAPPR